MSSSQTNPNVEKGIDLLKQLGLLVQKDASILDNQDIRIRLERLALGQEAEPLRLLRALMVLANNNALVIEDTAYLPLFKDLAYRAAGADSFALRDMASLNRTLEILIRRYQPEQSEE